MENVLVTACCAFIAGWLAQVFLNGKSLKTFLKTIKHQNQHIMVTQQEVAQQLVALKEQLTKIGAEITAKLAELEEAIENAGEASPEVEAALAALNIAVQGVDNLIPDALPVEPPVEPPMTP